MKSRTHPKRIGNVLVVTHKLAMLVLTMIPVMIVVITAMMLVAEGDRTEGK